jgi:hypothetical protein
MQNFRIFRIQIIWLWISYTNYLYLASIFCLGLISIFSNQFEFIYEMVLLFLLGTPVIGFFSMFYFRRKSVWSYKIDLERKTLQLIDLHQNLIKECKLLEYTLIKTKIRRVEQLILCHRENDKEQFQIDVRTKNFKKMEILLSMFAGEVQCLSEMQ